MRWTVPAVVAAALLSGCTPMQWVKADGTPEQLDQDSIQCQQDAWREARLRYWQYPPIPAVVVQDAQGRRFLAGGSGPFASPFADPLLEESRLAQLCMLQKGYELVPVAPKK